VSADWKDWARRVERALDAKTRTDNDFQALFAADGVFVDPTQTASTEDLPEVSRRTEAIFPDWTTEVTRIDGNQGWAVFEWIGRGTFKSTAIEMEGITLVDVDGQGLVTRWRDYFDMKAVEEQFRSALS